jgi:hypothetical protein
VHLRSGLHGPFRPTISSVTSEESQLKCRGNGSSCAAPPVVIRQEPVRGLAGGCDIRSQHTLRPTLSAETSPR